jgi:hypothetical protein
MHAPALNTAVSRSVGQTDFVTLSSQRPESEELWGQPFNHHYQQNAADPNTAPAAIRGFEKRLWKSGQKRDTLDRRSQPEFKHNQRNTSAAVSE